MQEKQRKSRNNILIILTFLASIIYLIWRLFYTIPLDFGIVAFISGMTLLLVEIGGMSEAAVHFYNMFNIKTPEKPEVDEKDFPPVDVLIATYNEPVELLYKTVNACVNMAYPDKKNVHIYLCDDGNREEVRELAQKMGIYYIARTERTHAKAGNLNHALTCTSSPLIVTFDADMIPMSDFLMTCVPYFFTGEKVGFIQLPQSFYNLDLFQYNLFSEERIPNEQDYFYRDVQVAKNKTNSVIYGGSNTMLAREALEAIGGFYTEVITEDFATGILIQSKGYRCYALGEIHASGLSPSDLESLVKQRERWGRGCIQTNRKLHILFKKGLNIKQKINYITSISYWYSGLKRLVYIMSPILFSVFGIMVIECSLVEVLIFWLPTYLLTGASLKLLSDNIRTTKWTNVYETILFPVLLPSVVLETFGISQKTFVVTKKDGSASDGRYSVLLAIPHIALTLLMAVGIINGIRMMFVTGSAGYLIVLFWLINNFYNGIMALFFIMGRKRFRTKERFALTLPCQITFKGKAFKGKEIKCHTRDISEGGISVILEFPEYLPPEEVYTLEVYTEKYRSKCEAKLIQVDGKCKEWKYAFVITDRTESDYRQLLHLLHDRVPPLPHCLNENSLFDDLTLNINKRKKKSIAFNRKLPRIPLRVDLKAVDVSHQTHRIKIINFNYHYMLIKMEHEVIKEKLFLQIEGFCLVLTYKEKVGTTTLLYSIHHDKEMLERLEKDAFKEILLKWMAEYEQEQKRIAHEAEQKRKEEKLKEEYNEFDL